MFYSLTLTLAVDADFVSSSFKYLNNQLQIVLKEKGG
ncbi:hypothetical protein RCH20_000440 [Psychrobacter sp. PL15]|nr:hypothetical protein [Psychrobacter sp. PL15]